MPNINIFIMIYGIDMAQNIEYEPLVWENTDGLDAEGKRLLRSFARMMDAKHILCLRIT